MRYFREVSVEPMTEHSILIRQVTTTERAKGPKDYPDHKRIVAKRTIVLERKQIEQIVEIYCDREDWVLVKASVIEKLKDEHIDVEGCETGDFPELEDGTIDLAHDSIDVLLFRARNPKD